jgi:hypothetical protein
MADDPRSKLLGVGVDVVGSPLDDHQPDRVRGKAQGAMLHEGTMDGSYDGVICHPSQQPTVVSGASFDVPRWKLILHRLFIGNLGQRFGGPLDFGHIEGRRGCCGHCRPRVP